MPRKYPPRSGRKGSGLDILCIRTSSIVKHPRLPRRILRHRRRARLGDIGLGAGIRPGERLAEGVVEDVVEVLVPFLGVLVAERFGHGGAHAVAAVEDKVFVVDVLAHPVFDLGYVGGVFEVVALDEVGAF